jgi:hypothetical protein
MLLSPVKRSRICRPKTSLHKGSSRYEEVICERIGYRMITAVQ